MAEAWDPERMDILLLLADRETSLGFDGAGDFFLGRDGRLARRGAAVLVPPLGRHQLQPPMGRLYRVKSV
jgi:MurNAc alpha-1-phosphate uridylyltransferase